MPEKIGPLMTITSSIMLLWTILLTNPNDHDKFERLGAKYGTIMLAILTLTGMVVWWLETN